VIHISVLKYLIKYIEQGQEKTARAYTYDIETYIKVFQARRKGIQVTGNETL
jgi:hypothetical protein